MSQLPNTSSSEKPALASHTDGEVKMAMFLSENSALKADAPTNIVSSVANTTYKTGPIASVSSSSTGLPRSYSASSAAHARPVVSPQSYDAGYARSMYGGPVLVKAPAQIPLAQPSVQYYQGHALMPQVGVVPAGVPPTLQQTTGLPPPSLQHSAAGPPPSMQPPTALPPPAMQPTVVPQPALPPTQAQVQPHVLQPRLMQSTVMQAYQYSQTVAKQQVYSATQAVQFAAPAPATVAKPVFYAPVYPQPAAAYYTGQNVTAATSHTALQNNQVLNQCQVGSSNASPAQATYAIQSSSQLQQISQYPPAMVPTTTHPSTIQHHASNQIQSVLNETASKQQTVDQTLRNQDQPLNLAKSRRKSAGSVQYTQPLDRNFMHDSKLSLNPSSDPLATPPLTRTAPANEAEHSKYRGFETDFHMGIKLQKSTLKSTEASATEKMNINKTTSYLDPVSYFIS